MRKIVIAAHFEKLNDVALLILRLGLGILTMHHGYQKISHFNMMKSDFFHLFELSGAASLTLAIMAEFFCAMFVMLGLFTRMFATPLIITMSVALFDVKNGDVFGGGESAALYLLGYICLFVSGSGALSVERLIVKKRIS